MYDPKTAIALSGNFIRCIKTSIDGTSFIAGQYYQLFNDWDVHTTHLMFTEVDAFEKGKTWLPDYFEDPRETYRPGTRLKLTPKTRKFAAEAGTDVTVGPKGWHFCDTVEDFHVDCVFTGGSGQVSGGYNHQDFEIIGHPDKVLLTPQSRAVLAMLKSIGRITGVHAWNVLKVRSLSRRITELKRAGYRIERNFKADHTGQRYAEYTLN